MPITAVAVLAASGASYLILYSYVLAASGRFSLLLHTSCSTEDGTVPADEAKLIGTISSYICSTILYGLPVSMVSI